MWVYRKSSSSLIPTSFCTNPAGNREVRDLFVVVLFVALKKRISLKILILSGFVSLKSIPFNLLCVLGSLKLMLPGFQAVQLHTTGARVVQHHGTLVTLTGSYTGVHCCVWHCLCSLMTHKLKTDKCELYWYPTTLYTSVSVWVTLIAK